ncbi:hypothetical protein A3732_10740, partial [Oleiphilus sp. HI0050]
FAQKNNRFDAPQNVFLVLMIPVILISGIANGWIGGAIGSVTTFITSIFLPFLLIQNTITTLQKQRVAMLFLIGCALVMVHDGSVQKSSETGLGWSGAGLSEKTRITYLGIFSDPNDLGMFFVMILPMAMYFLFRAKAYLKPAFCIVVAFILHGIYMTNSRGALLGTMSQLVVWFYLKYGLKKSLSLGAFVLPLAIFVMGKFRKIDSEEASAEGRLDAWYEGFHMLMSNPVLGVGMGQFTEYHHLTAHNSFVLVFSELGLLGYFLWMGFMVGCVYLLLVLWYPKMEKSFVNHIDLQESEIARTLTYSMIGFMVTSFFLSRAYTPLLYIFCGMLVAVYYRATKGRRGDPELRFRYSSFSSVLIKSTIGSLVVIYLAVKVLL